MPKSNRKGGKFERDLCKRLSEWWKPGRDDIFWRSQTSGGRATLRARKGKKTFGSYGDIAAVDPIGLPLLKVFTIEAKRGGRHGNPGDMIDLPRMFPGTRPFEHTIKQATDSAREAGSWTWMIISQRDRRVPMVYATWFRLVELLGKVPMTRVRIRHRATLGCIPLEKFLEYCTPEIIREKAKQI